MRKKIFLVTLLLLTLACALPGAETPVIQLPTTDPNALKTIVAQTANAALTQTAGVVPTITNTSTPTRIPSITPTSTVTFIFLFPTLTPFSTQTPIGQIPQGGGGGGGGGSGGYDDSIYTDQPWSCRVTSTQPPKGAIIQKETTFFAYWSILNTGTTTWDRNSVDLKYTGGYRHIGTKIQDFPRNVPTGGKIVMGAEFFSPKKEGEYNSYFVLEVGNRKFCGMSISFEILK